MQAAHLECEEVEDSAGGSGDRVRPAHLLDESRHDPHRVEVRQARHHQPAHTTTTTPVTSPSQLGKEGEMRWNVEGWDLRHGRVSEERDAEQLAGRVGSRHAVHRLDHTEDREETGS